MTREIAIIAVAMLKSVDFISDLFVEGPYSSFYYGFESGHKILYKE